MNRHHFSLFVRNCRLILLLRREFGDGDLKSFRPAEFRWKLPQVTCARLLYSYCSLPGKMLNYELELSRSSSLCISSTSSSLSSFSHIYIYMLY